MRVEVGEGKVGSEGGGGKRTLGVEVGVGEGKDLEGEVGGGERWGWGRGVGTVGGGGGGGERNLGVKVGEGKVGGGTLRLVEVGGRGWTGERMWLEVGEGKGPWGVEVGLGKLGGGQVMEGWRWGWNRTLGVEVGKGKVGGGGGKGP